MKEIIGREADKNGVQKSNFDATLQLALFSYIMHVCAYMHEHHMCSRMQILQIFLSRSACHSMHSDIADSRRPNIEKKIPNGVQHTMPPQKK